MLQLRGPGLGVVPWCSQAAVGQQCIPDGTIPPCSIAPVGAQCTPDGAGSPPTYTPPAPTNNSGGVLMTYNPPPSSVPVNPAPTGVIVGGAQPGTIITNPGPGTVATVGPIPAQASSFVSQLFSTWWGIGLLALGGYGAYRYSKNKKPAKAA